MRWCCLGVLENNDLINILYGHKESDITHGISVTPAIWLRWSDEVTFLTMSLCVFVPLLYELFCHIVICIASWVALAAVLWALFVQFCCSCASRFTVSCFHAKQQCSSRTLTYRAKWDPWRVSSERHPLCLCIQFVVSCDSEKLRVGLDFKNKKTNKSNLD